MTICLRDIADLSPFSPLAVTIIQRATSRVIASAAVVMRQSGVRVSPLPNCTNPPIPSRNVLNRILARMS